MTAKELSITGDTSPARGPYEASCYAAAISRREGVVGFRVLLNKGNATLLLQQLNSLVSVFPF